MDMQLLLQESRVEKLKMNKTNIKFFKSVVKQCMCNLFNAIIKDNDNKKEIRGAVIFNFLSQISKQK